MLSVQNLEWPKPVRWRQTFESFRTDVALKDRGNDDVTTQAATQLQAIQSCSRENW